MRPIKSGMWLRAGYVAALSVTGLTFAAPVASAAEPAAKSQPAAARPQVAQASGQPTASGAKLQPTSANSATTSAVTAQGALPGQCGPDACTTTPSTLPQTPTQAPFEDPSLSPLTQQPPASNFNPGTGSIGNPNTFAAANSAGGYLDPAAPMSMFRLRYDNARDNNFPDRGEYFYAQCGCFRFDDQGRPTGSGAQGPDGINRGVNFQTIRSYLEVAFSPRFSVFADLPATFVNYDVAPEDAGFAGAHSPGYTSGFGDMTAGFKYAIIAQEDRYLTFQLKTYIPTGDSFAGLGTGHASLEPGMLYFDQLTDKVFFQAQVKNWQGLDVSSFASNVFEYGWGLGYQAWEHEHFTVTPVFEMVGWTFIGGQKFSPITGLQSASGDTIVNVKPGVRFAWGDSCDGVQRHSIYTGWGHAITSERLYEDIFRVEYRWLF